MTTFELFEFGLVLLVALPVGMGVAYLQERAYRKKRRRVRRPPPPTSSETVYSAFDGDNMPLESDIDPLEEAELYLAYGNKRGALAVLEKAAKSMPARDDIRLKLEAVRAQS